MTYKILLHPKAAKSYNKLNKELKGRIKKKIKSLKEKPESYGKPLKYSNFWSLRIGEYRIIYEINKKNKQIIILFIGHRKHAYTDFSKIF